MEHLHGKDLAVLAALSEVGGSVTGQVTKRANISFGHNARTSSALTRSILLSLQKRGFVNTLDDQKPVCWVRTPAGSSVLNTAGIHRRIIL